MASKKVRMAVLLIVTAVITMGAVLYVSANTVDQKSTLSGAVLPDRLVVAGASVREGDVLVTVAGVAGPATAVRATTDGIVKEVLVHPGEVIHMGDVLVRIEPVHK